MASFKLALYSAQVIDLRQRGLTIIAFLGFILIMAIVVIQFGR